MRNLRLRFSSSDSGTYAISYHSLRGAPELILLDWRRFDAHHTKTFSCKVRCNRSNGHA